MRDMRAGQVKIRESFKGIEKLRNYHNWDIEIMATDIDTGAFEKAIFGLYLSRSVENVPKEYMNKYFVSNGELFRVKSVVKKPVKFMHMNLIDKKMMHKPAWLDHIGSAITNDESLSEGLFKAKDKIDFHIK